LFLTHSHSHSHSHSYSHSHSHSRGLLKLLSNSDRASEKSGRKRANIDDFLSLLTTAATIPCDLTGEIRELAKVLVACLGWLITQTPLLNACKIEVSREKEELEKVREEYRAVAEGKGGGNDDNNDDEEEEVRGRNTVSEASQQHQTPTQLFSQLRYSGCITGKGKKKKKGGGGGKKKKSKKGKDEEEMEVEVDEETIEGEGGDKMDVDGDENSNPDLNPSAKGEPSILPITIEKISKALSQTRKNKVELREAAELKSLMETLNAWRAKVRVFKTFFSFYVDVHMTVILDRP